MSSKPDIPCTSLSNLDRRDCTPCRTGVNEHEDVIIDRLIPWLERVSCIRWIRANSEGNRPDVNSIGVVDGQYGTVFISGSFCRPMKETDITDHLNGEGCLKLVNSIDVSLSLVVYRNKGVECQTGQPYGSASDVLWRVYDMYHVRRLRAMLNQMRISVDSFGRISNIPLLENESYEIRASQELQLCVGRESSIAVEVYESICLDLCSQPPLPAN